MVKKATATTPYQKNSTPQTGDVDQLAGDILDEIRGLAQISDKIERATESALKKIAFAERKIEATQNRVEKEIYQMQKTTEKEIQRERPEKEDFIDGKPDRSRRRAPRVAWIAGPTPGDDDDASPWRPDKPRRARAPLRHCRRAR